MTAEIINHTDNIITVKITGKLSYPQLIAIQNSTISIIRQQGNIRMLIIAENFKGWEKEGDWGDLTFQTENDAYIEKMAIVGEKQWEEMALMFTAKGFRDFPIEYFQPDDLLKAQCWLKEE
jgi:hypothetical protein